MTTRAVRRFPSRHLILAGILSLAAVLRLWGLGAESLWFDESYSVWVAQHSVGWHISLSFQRIFPPLYYLMLHFWLPLGTSEVAVRLLSVLCGLVSVLGVYALARELFDQRVAWLSAFLLAISPLHLWYSQEARMYIVVAALGIWAAYFLLRAVHENKPWQWAGFIIAPALAMNAHYFALFFVPFYNLYALYLAWHDRTFLARWKTWVFSQVAMGLLSVVGLAGIFSSESDYWWGVLDSWHGAPNIYDLIDLMFQFSLGTTARGALFYRGSLVLFGLILLANLSFRNWRSFLGLDRAMVFTLLYLLVPLATVFALSQVRSFWVLRYIFPFMPPYCILVARGLSRIPWRWPRLVVFIAVVLVTAWPVANTYRYQQKEDWRGAVQYIAESEQAGDIIFLLDEDIWLPFDHYYRGSLERNGISRQEKDPAVIAARLDDVVDKASRIWLVLSHTDNLMVKDDLLSRSGVQMVSARPLTGIEIDLFEVRSR